MTKNRQEFSINFLGANFCYATETQDAPPQQQSSIAKDDSKRAAIGYEANRGASSRDEGNRGAYSRDEGNRGAYSRDEGNRGAYSRDEGNRGAYSRGNNKQSRVIAFYKNEIPSEPNGDLIDRILNNWHGNYSKLDDFNTYIQWLFPSRECGKNPTAPLLTDEDVEIIKYCGFDQTVMKAFAMMLDFYGLELKNNTIVLAENHRERLQLITSDGKYYFVISRILSFLKELGEQKLMITWLKVLADLIQKNLLDEDAKISFNSYWIKTLDNNGIREVKEYIQRINRN